MFQLACNEVPIVVVLTKFDKLLENELNELDDQDEEVANANANARVNEIRKTIISVVTGTDRPITFVIMKGIIHGIAI
jgi:GTP-binding protein EngB required for normal cell division